MLALAVSGRMILATGFIRDDYYIVAGNALLNRWRLLPQLLSTGYWEGALGGGAPVQEYRPVLMLSYFLNRLALGGEPWGFHLGNAFLHAGVVVALFFALKKRLDSQSAWLASALFAVLPVHVEAIAPVTGRSELLAALFLLLSWLDLERPGRERRGFLWYALALLSKEQAVVFPVFVAAADWTFAPALAAARKKIHAGLWALTAAALLLRCLVLEHPFHGGFDYFAGADALTRALTVAKFWALHYAWPTLAGRGLCADYARPLIPDSGVHDVGAWLALLAWLGLAAASLASLIRRRAAGLVGLLFFLPLLPTSHFLIRLDTIGAERFLYLPSIAFCILAAAGLKRLNSRARWAAAAAAVLIYAVESVARESAWLSPRAYAEAAMRDNPVSAGARSAYGVELAREGNTEGARQAFTEAIRLDPRQPAAYYNLARLDFEQGKLDQAESVLAQNADVLDVDAWTLRALIAERRGRWTDAVLGYERAVALRPWDAAAHFNLGRLALAAGLKGSARLHFERYCDLAPDAPDAPEVRRLLLRLPSPSPRTP